LLIDAQILALFHSLLKQFEGSGASIGENQRRAASTDLSLSRWRWSDEEPAAQFEALNLLKRSVSGGLTYQKDKKSRKE
jgi:hypothetical protein